MSVVVIEQGYRKKAVCRELVTEAGGQRPGSIIVEINREELKREVRGERDGGWWILTKRNGRGAETTRRRVVVNLVVPGVRGAKIWRGPTFMIKVHQGSTSWRCMTLATLRDASRSNVRSAVLAINCVSQDQILSTA